jgi:hypothetical protein
MKTRSPRAAAVFAALLFVACDAVPPVASDAASASDQFISFNFMNGPLDLPNVLRGDGIVISAWADVAQDIAIVVNTPAGGVSDFRRCGGAFGPTLQPVQTVGELQGVLRELRLLRDVSIHLYRPVPDAFFQPPAGKIPLDAFCAASPFAQGTANVTSTDNDRLVTESSANAFGFRAQGLVDLAGGGSSRLTAIRQAVIGPDGTLDVQVSSVMLHQP